MGLASKYKKKITGSATGHCTKIKAPKREPEHNISIFTPNPDYY